MHLLPFYKPTLKAMPPKHGNQEFYNNTEKLYSRNNFSRFTYFRTLYPYIPITMHGLFVRRPPSMPESFPFP